MAGKWHHQDGKTKAAVMPKKGAPKKAAVQKGGGKISIGGKPTPRNQTSMIRNDKMQTGAKSKTNAKGRTVTKSKSVDGTQSRKDCH